MAKDNPETNPITINPDHQPCDRAVPLGSLTLLLSTRVPFPNKISCSVGICVSSDNSFLSVRQEPSVGPWKGSPFLQQNVSGASLRLTPWPCFQKLENFKILTLQNVWPQYKLWDPKKWPLNGTLIFAKSRETTQNFLMFCCLPVSCPPLSLSVRFP